MYGRVEIDDETKKKLSLLLKYYRKKANLNQRDFITYNGATICSAVVLLSAKIALADPAMPLHRAINPARRPITSMTLKQECTSWNASVWILISI